MVASFYHECGPRPASTNAARWYSPCLGKLFIGQYIVGFQQGHKIDWLGETVRNWATSAGSPTNCVDGTTYLAYHHRASAELGASVDIWGALRAGAWSSSTTFSVLCDGRDAYDTGNTILRVGIIKPDNTKNGMILLAKTVSELSVNCSTLPVVSYTVTVYDDGTYAIS